MSNLDTEPDKLLILWILYSIKIGIISQVAEAHAFNPSTRNTEAGESLFLKTKRTKRTNKQNDWHNQRWKHFGALSGIPLRSSDFLLLLF